MRAVSGNDVEIRPLDNDGSEIWCELLKQHLDKVILTIIVAWPDQGQYYVHERSRFSISLNGIIVSACEHSDLAKKGD